MLGATSHLSPPKSLANAKQPHPRSRGPHNQFSLWATLTLTPLPPTPQTRSQTTTHNPSHIHPRTRTLARDRTLRRLGSAFCRRSTSCPRLHRSNRRNRRRLISCEAAKHSCRLLYHRQRRHPPPLPHLRHWLLRLRHGRIFFASSQVHSSQAV
jgi:hypothetical protein